MTTNIVINDSSYIILFLTWFSGAETQINRWKFPSIERCSTVEVLQHHANTCCDIILANCYENVSKWVTCVFPQSSSWLPLVNNQELFTRFSLAGMQETHYLWWTQANKSYESMMNNDKNKTQQSTINSLAPGRSAYDSKNGIYNLVLLIGIFRSSHDNALRWMQQDLTDDKSTLVQVMAWCRQATSHYLNQCWPRSLALYGVTRPYRICCKWGLIWQYQLQWA